MRLIISMLLLVAGSAAQAALVTVDFEATLPTYFGLTSYQQDGITLTSNVPDGTLIDVNNVVRGNLGVPTGGTASQTLFWGDNSQVGTISLSAQKIKNFWEDQGIEFQDSLTDSLLPPSLMYNTNYHPKDLGRQKRTKIIIALIRKQLKVIEAQP